MTPNPGRGQLLDDERMVLDLLLAGEHPALEVLRAQAAAAEVASRLEAGEVRIVRVEIPSDLPRCDLEVAELGDVLAEFDNGSGRGLASVVVRDGALSSLGVTCFEGAPFPGGRLTRAGYCVAQFSAGDPESVPVAEEIAERDRVKLEESLDPNLHDREEAEGLEHTLEVVDALASRPHDSIALPLVAPIVALLDRLALEQDVDEPPPDEAGPVARAGWEGLKVSIGLRRVVDDPTVAREVGLADLGLPMTSIVRCYKQWLRDAQPEPVLAALLACRLADRLEGGIADERARPLARLVFHHVRTFGIADWESAYQHARGWWSTPEGRDEVWDLVLSSAHGQLAAAEAEAGRINAHRLALLGQQLLADEEREAAPAAAAGPASEAPHVSDDGARHDEEVERLTSRLQERVRELEAARTRKKQLLEQARELTAQLAEARAELAKEQKQRRALGYQLRESREAEAVGDRSIEPPPDEGWRDDLLAGYTIVLFTGQERASAREDMAQALRDVGAVVTVEECNSKGSVPDRFQDGVVVVTDVRFTGHAASDRIRAAAEKSGVRLLEIRAGEGGIVRAVAGKLAVGR